MDACFTGSNREKFKDFVNLLASVKTDEVRIVGSGRISREIAGRTPNQRVESASLGQDTHSHNVNGKLLMLSLPQ